MSAQPSIVVSVIVSPVGEFGAPAASTGFSGLCSWESSQPPKLTDRVQILADLLKEMFRRGRAAMQLFCKQPHGGSNPSAGLKVRGDPISPRFFKPGATRLANQTNAQ